MKIVKLHDIKRNLIVLIIACLLNFAFAMEKFFIVIESPLSDFTWMVIYFGVSLILTFVAFYDYVYDVKEDHGTDVERII